MIITQAEFQANVPKYLQEAVKKRIGITTNDGLVFEIVPKRPTRKERMKKLVGRISSEMTEQDGIDERVREYETGSLSL